MVNSATRAPHSAQWMKSGMNSRQSAASSSSGVCCLAASNWNSVLNCMNCRPVCAKISERGTFRKAFSIMPLVRASR